MRHIHAVTRDGEAKSCMCNWVQWMEPVLAAALHFSRLIRRTLALGVVEKLPHWGCSDA